MEAIPAIDLMNGKVVRLKQGVKETAKIYSDDPVTLAKRFRDEGAKWIHVVDLDRAFGTGDNLETISKIAKVPGIKIEVGGGVRNVEDAVELVEKKISRIVIGTAALDPKMLEQFTTKLGKKIWIACDAKDGQVAIKGWKQTTQITIEQLVETVSKLQIGGIIVTDISTDGMQNGISVEFLAKIRKITNVQLIASGGVSSIADVKRLADMGFDGCIIGKAIYEKRILLREAIQVGGKNAG